MLKAYLFDDIDETARESEMGKEMLFTDYDKEVINTVRHMVNDGRLYIPQSKQLQKIFSATSKTADELGIKFEQYISGYEKGMTEDDLRQFGAEFLHAYPQPRNISLENILYAYFRRKVSVYITDTRSLLKTTLGELSALVEDFRNTYPLLSQIYPDQIPGVKNEVIAVLQIFSGAYQELIQEKNLTEEMCTELLVDEVIERNKNEFEFKRDETLFAKYIDIAKEVLREKILEKVREEEVVSVENVDVEENNPAPESLTEEDKALLLEKIEKLLAENTKLANKLSKAKSKKKAVGMIKAGFGDQKSVTPSKIMNAIPGSFWTRFEIYWE